MKKIACLMALVATMFATCSCGVFANMSDEDAYNVGYGIGTAARYLIDNWYYEDLDEVHNCSTSFFDKCCKT